MRESGFSPLGDGAADDWFSEYESQLHLPQSGPVRRAMRRRIVSCDDGGGV